MPCPATTAGSSYGWQNPLPSRSASSLAAAIASSTDAPASITVAPWLRHASILEIGAPAGTKISHGTPKYLAANASDWAWLPALPAVTPALARGPERGDLVHRPADLERAGALQVLRLEHDRLAEVVRQRHRRDDRGVLGDGAGDAPSSGDVRQRDGVGGVASVHESATVVSARPFTQRLGMIGSVQRACRCISATTSRSSGSAVLRSLLGALLLGVAALLRPDKPSPAKLIAYEGGVDPVGIGWSQSQIRYYVFALLFVIFDVEAVFIFPWAAAVERYGGFGLAVMVAFIVLLLDGLLYAWKRGLLRWV